MEQGPLLSSPALLTRLAMYTSTWPVFVIAAALVLVAPPSGDAREHDKTVILIKPELEQFDEKCSLSPLAHDKALFDYVRQRVSPNSYHWMWSPRKLMDTVIDLTSAAADLTDEQRDVWVFRSGLKEETRLQLEVHYNTDESKDTGFFKERRTCSDRLAAQASADFDFFVKSYSKSNLSLTNQGSLTITHGTWTSDVDERLKTRDRALYRQIYDYYKRYPERSRLAVVGRMRAITILFTGDRASSARLEAGLSASAGLSYVKGDLNLESSAAAGQVIQIQTVTTLVGTLRNEWIREGRRSFPQVDIGLSLLPSRQEVESRLKEGVQLLRDVVQPENNNEWIAQQGAPLALPIRIGGVTKEECDHLSIGGPSGDKFRTSAVTSREWIEGKCRVIVAASPLLKSEELEYTASYNGLNLASLKATVIVDALIKGRVVTEGRDSLTQLPRWELEFTGSKQDFSVQSWTGSIAFTCPDESTKTSAASAMQDNTAKRAVLSVHTVLDAGCRATPPTLQVIPRGGSAADAPIQGVLVVR